MDPDNENYSTKDKISVVIVENDLIVANSLKESLEHQGYKVLNCFSNAESFLNNISGLSPDVILIDVMLDGTLNGVDLAEMIQPNEKSAIIFMSAHFDKTILKNTIFEYGYPFLAKPIGNRELTTTIEKEFIKHKNLLNQSKDNFNTNFISAFEDETDFNESSDVEKSVEVIKRDFLNEVLYHIRYIESSFEQILNEPQILILIVDKSGFVNYVNDTAFATYGFESKQLFNQNIYDIVHPDEMDKLKFAIKSSLNEPAAQVSVNIRFNSNIQKWIYFNCIFQMLSNNEESPYIAVTCLNIGKINDVLEILDNLEHQIVHSFDDIELTKLKPSINIFQAILSEIISERKKNLTIIAEFVNDSFHSVMGFSGILGAKIKELSVKENAEFNIRIKKHLSILKALAEKKQEGGISIN